MFMRDCKDCYYLDKLLFKDQYSDEQVYYYRCKKGNNLWEDCEDESP